MVRNLPNELIINFEQHNFRLNKINLSNKIQTKLKQKCMNRKSTLQNWHVNLFLKIPPLATEKGWEATIQYQTQEPSLES